MSWTSELAGSFVPKLPATNIRERNVYNMFLEPSCLVVGYIPKPSKEYSISLEKDGFKVIYGLRGCYIIFWESVTSSIKNAILIPQFYKGDIFLAGREFGRQYLDPYGEAQVACDLDGKPLQVTGKDKGKFLFAVESGEVTSVNCTTTAGGKEISIVEYYLTNNNGKHFVNKKKIYSQTSDNVDYKSFGVYEAAVRAVVLRAHCYDCVHLHYGTQEEKKESKNELAN